FTAVVTSGPTNGAVSNEKRLIVPSQRPTAKCSASSHLTSWARLYVVPFWVIGSVDVIDCGSVSASRERRTGGSGWRPDARAARVAGPDRACPVTAACATWGTATAAPAPREAARKGRRPKRRMCRSGDSDVKDIVGLLVKE